MKVYLVLEGSGINAPNDRAELIYGVFSSKKGATECLEHHCRHVSSLGWPELIRKDGKAYDENGNIYFQILTLEQDTCRKDAWL
jgi:hypothetical protein